MPKFTLDNSFRFYSQNETTTNFHSESIERPLQKLSSADWLPLYAREGPIQADLMGWKKMLLKINDVLDDSMKKQATNNSVNMWLAKLQNLAYDVQDLLDEFQTETFRRELMPGELTTQPCKSHQLNSMAMSRVKEVTARLQNISRQIALLGLKSRNVRRRLVPTSLKILAAVRGGRREPSPTIFSPLINEANLAFLKNGDCLDFLENLGTGPLGEVYKAELPGSNGKMVAFKTIVLSPKYSADWLMEQIRCEIAIAGQIRHMNIVPLLAHVAKPDCHLLVYEFMKNGSLQDILNDVARGRRELDWLDRHRIALGVASGLEHLHFNHRPTIIHTILTPRNVLLDDEMTAKIAYFCRAKALPDTQTHVETSYLSGPVGFLGYIAPEYFNNLIVTCKCDIYSFGVLLAVLVTGKFPSDEIFFHAEKMSLSEEVNLVKWMTNIMSSENPVRAIDSKLLGKGYEDQMLLALKIACLCTSDNPEERPNSKDVRCMLSQIQQMSLNVQE